jgi:hypothetical protein
VWLSAQWINTGREIFSAVIRKVTLVTEMSLCAMWTCRDVQIRASVIYIKIFANSNKYKTLEQVKDFRYVGSRISSVQSDMGHNIMKYNNINEVMKRNFDRLWVRQADRDHDNVLYKQVLGRTHKGCCPLARVCSPTSLVLLMLSLGNVQLVQWDMSYGLELCSTHLNREQLKVIAHVPPNKL